MKLITLLIVVILITIKTQTKGVNMFGNNFIPKDQSDNMNKYLGIKKDSQKPEDTFLPGDLGIKLPGTDKDVVIPGGFDPRQF